jgi:hypothetical protein
MFRPMKNYVTYFFGFSNSLATNQELGELVGVPLFLWLEGPWIYSWNLTNTLDFWFWEIAYANQRRSALLEIF